MKTGQVTTCKYIADHYGETQLNLCMEEAAELIQALNKYLRTKKGQPPRGNQQMETIKRMVTEEIADVNIMLIQICHLLNISDDEVNDIINQKLARTLTIMVDEQELNRS